MNLLLQPYAQPKKLDTNNFITTIVNDFDLRRAVENSKSKQKPDLTEFIKQHPDGKSKVWALGENRNSRTVFTKINVGDLVLFHGKNEIYAYGSIDCKMHWPKNNFVWPTGENWDYLYSLRDVVFIPEGSRVNRASLKQIFPKVGHLSAFFIDLTEIGITQSEILRFLDTTPPNVPKNPQHTPTRGSADQPRLGEMFKGRLEIWRAFGGQWQQGIVVFPNEKIVNVFSDENGPYPDFIDPKTGTVEYRGQGLRGSQKLTLGNRLLEDARLKKSPIRFWHRQAKGRWEFKSWAVVEDRTSIIENDADNNSAVRLLWFLVPVRTPNATDWPEDLIEQNALDLPEISTEKPIDLTHLLNEYKKRSEGLDQDSPDESNDSKPRRKFKRRKEARDLVLARSQNECEFDKCTGMPFDIGKDGKSILEVDHIIDLAHGGPDVPRNMIALCPNCHKAKTYGKNSDKTIKQFQKIVKQREQQLLLN